MDNSAERQGSEILQQSNSIASLQIFERLMKWLAGLVRLTAEEQRDAGIYIGRQRDE